MLSLHISAVLSLAIFVTSATGNCDYSDRNATAELCLAAEACLEALEADISAECVSFPVPPDISPGQLRPVGYNLTELRDGLFVYYDGAYFTVLARSEDEVLVVDFPESGGTLKPDGSGTRITDALEEIMNGDTPKKIYMLYSHEHFDHKKCLLSGIADTRFEIGSSFALIDLESQIGTATLFQDFVSTSLYPSSEIEILGSEGTAERVASATSGRAPNVTHVIDSAGEKISIGDMTFELRLVGGHTNNDLLLYLPGVLAYHVDVVFPGWVPFADFALTIDLRDYIEVHYVLLDLDYEYFVGGHLTVIGSSKDVQHNLDYALAVLESARESVASVTDFSEVLAPVGNPEAAQFGDLWFGFRGVRFLQRDTCFRILVEKMGCKLAGITSWGRSHCFSAVLYVLIDE